MNGKKMMKSATFTPPDGMTPKGAVHWYAFGRVPWTFMGGY